MLTFGPTVPRTRRLRRFLLESVATAQEGKGTTGIDGVLDAALDAGTTAGELIARLTAVAAKPLPQPMTYLIEDVGRRHGSIRVTSLQCAVTSPDVVLLTEVQHQRTLSVLQLRRPALAAFGRGLFGQELDHSLAEEEVDAVLRG